jgi:hypothetical protein
VVQPNRTQRNYVVRTKRETDYGPATKIAGYFRSISRQSCARYCAGDGIDRQALKLCDPTVDQISVTTGVTTKSEDRD